MASFILLSVFDVVIDIIIDLWQKKYWHLLLPFKIRDLVFVQYWGLCLFSIRGFALEI